MFVFVSWRFRVSSAKGEQEAAPDRCRPIDCKPFLTPLLPFLLPPLLPLQGARGCT